MAEKNSDNKLDKIVALAKRRGFVYPSSEIYGGLSGVYDYGPLGVELKNNLKQLWWKMFVTDREDMFGLDAGILMNGRVWEASGHVAGFSDPLVECEKCHKRYRADHLESDKCPECAGLLSEARQFNMMFKTQIGAMEDTSATVYLRPETAQGIFVNFKNIIDSFHPKLPFGVGQIGKAFRNEITPRDFVFRVREFEQMEIEYFVKVDEWEKAFDDWRLAVWEYLRLIGLDETKVHELEILKEDLAHYSKRTIDFEFDYPFGRKELLGLAYRTDFDLKAHQETSGQILEYFDEESKERFTPHVIEPSFGLDRQVLAILLSAYREEEVAGEVREYLALAPAVAPTKVAVSPLLKNKPELVSLAREVFATLKKQFGRVTFDDNGNIGKRYRRQDEIGTPYCVVIDFDSLEKGTVTVRERDSMEQAVVKIDELTNYLAERLN